MGCPKNTAGLGMTRIYNYKKEMADELKQLLQYWMDNTVDDPNGGFAGQIDENNQMYPEAPKGSVLNSRILYTFAAAYTLTNNAAYLKMADRAFTYICNHFIDPVWGGVFWSVDYLGRPLDTKKQVYASAFTLYALSAYYECSKNELVKEMALALFLTIEKYSFDTVQGGYIDAFARDWTPMEDIRLSAKDANASKTMNTHLHLLEAYTAFYRINPDDFVRERLLQLIRNFSEHFIHPSTGHLQLFFNEKWELQTGPVSYGHDIEASWLLLEAAEVLGDLTLIDAMKELSLSVAEAAIEGLDKDGGLWYERSEHSNELIREKHWWPQAEAMVGFFNAYQVSGDDAYLKLSLDSWGFVKKFIKDTEQGEWFWGVEEDYTPMKGQDKVGIWKCPYHNGRACMEILRRSSGI